MTIKKLIESTDLQSFKAQNINLLMVAEELTEDLTTGTDTTTDCINFNIEDYAEIPRKWLRAEVYFQELRQRKSGKIEIVYSCTLFN